jgi:HTH-type transcriptional regulator/antitoxin HigA
MDIKPIRGEADYERALRRVEELWDSPEGSAESDELDILTTLIEAYEREHYPIDLPDPIEAIKFRLEQKGKDSRALIGVIGQRTRVYEVMRGKRPLSLNMIRNLHEKLDIPAEVLIQPARRGRRVGVHRSGTSRRRGGMRKLGINVALQSSEPSS